MGDNLEARSTRPLGGNGKMSKYMPTAEKPYVRFAVFPGGGFGVGWGA